MNANGSSSPRIAAALMALAMAGSPVIGTPGTEANPVATPHVLKLSDGDQLAGTVASFGEGGLLSFVHPSATAPIGFRLAAVRGIEAATPPAESAAAPATLSFNNGDSVPVDVLSMKGSSLAISSAVAGKKFTLPWDTVAGIRFNDASNSRIFSGPFPTQNWLIFDKSGDKAKDGGDPGKRSWRMENNEISGSGSGCAAVDAGLPDMAIIEWEMHWTGMLNCSIGFFCDCFAPVDPADPDGAKVWQEMRQDGRGYLHKEGISLDINPHSLLLHVATEGNGQEMVGSAQMPSIARAKSSAAFKVAVNRALGTLSFSLDGKPIQTWSDLGELPSRGKAISVWQQHDHGSLRLAKLQVAAWDGKSTSEAPEPEYNKDVLISTDGSRFSGHVGDFDGTAWSISGIAGDIHVKRPDIRHILRPVAKAIAPPPQSAVAHLPGGHSLHLSDPRLSADGLLQGMHPVLGPISLPFRHLESLVFPSVSSQP